MNYVINLISCNFSRQLDEVAAKTLASVSSFFVLFKYRNSSLNLRKIILNFEIDQPFYGNALD